MPFCYSPWTNIDISTLGNMTPCCKFRVADESQRINIQSSSIDNYKNSKFVQDIKQTFLNGQWPEGCIRCQKEEENSILSKRQLDYQRWEHHYKNYSLESDQLITASLSLGNTCNLKCITCHPDASSKWQKEYNDIYSVNVIPFKFYKQNFVQDFVNNAPNIRHIDIAGGEPFLSGVDEQLQMLDYYIDSKQAENITLHYNTNVTIWPGNEWWSRWAHFREIDMQLSIDGVGKQYEYIRHPADWSILETNVTKYLEQESQRDNFRLSVSHTVSAYNVFYLEEFFDWVYNIGLPKPWLGLVHNPVYMRPSVWSDSAKNLIINKLNSSKHQDIKSWASIVAVPEDQQYFNNFKQNCQQHDAYRNLDFKNTFKELAHYL